MLVEIHNTLNIELRTQHIEEDVLTLALVELTDRVSQLIEHREALA